MNSTIPCDSWLGGVYGHDSECEALVCFAAFLRHMCRPTAHGAIALSLAKMQHDDMLFYCEQ